VIEKLRSYCELIVDWNTRVSNLMSIKDHSRIVERHLLECLEPAHLLKTSGAERWVDFGSGAGLPAIPLSLAGVGSEWLLVDSRRSKVLFLMRAIADLKLNGVLAVHSRFETLEEALRERSELRNVSTPFDAMTSRATASIPETLAIAAALVRPGGRAFLWKGSRRDEEMASDPEWRESWSLETVVPCSTGATAVCVFVRE